MNDFESSFKSIKKIIIVCSLNRFFFKIYFCLALFFSLTESQEIENDIKKISVNGQVSNQIKEFIEIDILALFIVKYQFPVAREDTRDNKFESTTNFLSQEV